MATMGIPGDVNNSIFISNAYPFGRTFGLVDPAGSDFDYSNNYSGELGSLNQDYAMAPPVNPNMQSGTQAGSRMRAGQTTQSGPATTKMPAIWFLGIVLALVVMMWLARRYAPDGEQYAQLRPSLINLTFLTGFIVVISVVLKQIALRMQGGPLHSLSDVILAS